MLHFIYIFINKNSLFIYKKAIRLILIEFTFTKCCSSGQSICLELYAIVSGFNGNLFVELNLKIWNF